MAILSGIVAELCWCGSAALLGGFLAVKKVLKERQAAIDAELRRQEEVKRQREAALYAAQQQAIAEQRAREAAERERLRIEQEQQEAWEAAERERRRQEQIEREKKKVLLDLEAEYYRKWKCPSNSLFLGSFRAHPMHGTGYSLPAILSGYKQEYDQYRADLPIWFTGQEMGVTIGTVGSQKFTTAVAPNVLVYDGSCFIIDVAGEICAVTATARKNHHKQQVYRLDPFGYTKFSPEAYQPPLASFNPMDLLDPLSGSFEEDVLAFVEALATPRPSSSDPFWSDGAKDLLIAVIMFVCIHPDCEGKRSLFQVHEYLTQDAVGMDWMLGQMAKSIFAVLRGFANTYNDLDNKHRSTFRQQAKNEISLFVSQKMQDVMNQSSFAMKDFFEGRCTVYLVLPPKQMDSHKRWLRLMLSMFINSATEDNDNNHVLWIIDEAAQLGKLDVIPRAYTLLRKYGVRIWTFWQDLGQLQSTYPEQWRSLIGNSFVQVTATKDKDTASYFAELAGKHEVVKTSEGVTKGGARTVGTNSTSGSSSGESRTASDSVSTTSSSGSSYSSTNGPQGGSSTWSKNSGDSQGRSNSNSETHNTSTSHSSGRSESTTENFSATTTRSWQMEARIDLSQLTAMPRGRMYISCPNELPGFIDKHPYHDNPLLNVLATPNPYHRLKGSDENKQIES